MSNDTTSCMSILEEDTSSTNPQKTGSRGTGRATIHCRCRAVQLELTSSSPRYVAECCWKECHEILTWLVDSSSAGSSGHSSSGLLPTGLKPKQVPIREAYYDNAIHVQRGRDKLKFYKLQGLAKKDRGSWMACSICSSFLLGSHPTMQGNAVCVYLDLGTLIGAENVQQQRPLIRWYDETWTGDPSKLDQSVPAVWYEDSSSNIVGSGPSWVKTMSMALGKFKEPPVVPPDDDAKEWSSFSDLLVRFGGGEGQTVQEGQIGCIRS